LLSSKLSKNQSISLKEFQEVLLESLARYTKNKINIFITLQNLNSTKQLSQNQIKDFKITLRQLRKFVKNSFFLKKQLIFYLLMLEKENRRNY